ncbi:WGR domain-containing protein [Thiohalocapsa marina]|uniref:WGR domain-containing protein n=1 Tax=Thiohalocapsa marina TaxID=424902 RepID=A0A5M8FRV7_9GAMM|nr:WGR domain-containing protein [Thiohalocapsa marina]KAA6184232.1 WGR domain-containing protein [Thiohalocapsa marina]
MLRWVHVQKQRYYQADLMEDLLGGWSVITAWGGLGSRLGRMRTHWVETREAGEQRLREIAERRRRHGYQPRGEGAGSQDQP